MTTAVSKRRRGRLGALRLGQWLRLGIQSLGRSAPDETEKVHGRPRLYLHQTRYSLHLDQSAEGCNEVGGQLH